MHPLAAIDEHRRRTMRRVLIERVVLDQFPLEPGKTAPIGAVHEAVAARLGEKLGQTLRREIRAVVAAFNYKPGTSNGVRVYRRTRNVRS